MSWSLSCELLIWQTDQAARAEKDTAREQREEDGRSSHLELFGVCVGFLQGPKSFPVRQADVGESSGSKDGWGPDAIGGLLRSAPRDWSAQPRDADQQWPAQRE